MNNNKQDKSYQIIKNADSKNVTRELSDELSKLTKKEK